ncbi:hypothetical protein JCM8547_003159 [Rhodosporidiobolus lusitaniae]
MLWRTIVLRKAEQVASLIRLLQSKQVDELVRCVRVLRGRDVFCATRLVNILPHLPAQVEVELVGLEKEVRMEEIAVLSSIASLSLFRLDLTSTTRLSSLVQLSFVSICLFPSTSATFLVPSNLPSLRALSLANCHTPEGYLLLPTVPSSLLDQLHMLQLFTPNPSIVPSHTFTSSTPVLLTIQHQLYQPLLDKLLATKPPHLRVLPRRASETVPSKDHVRSTALLFHLRALVESSSRPRSLHLPVFLRDLDPTSFPISTERLSGLLEACRKCGVEVLWHGETDEAQTKISKEWWRYVKRSRRSSRSVTRRETDDVIEKL